MKDRDRWGRESGKNAYHQISSPINNYTLHNAASGPINFLSIQSLTVSKDKTPQRPTPDHHRKSPNCNPGYVANHTRFSDWNNSVSPTYTTKRKYDFNGRHSRLCHTNRMKQTTHSIKLATRCTISFFSL